MGKKLREEIYLEETSCFLSRALSWRPTDLRPPPKNYLYGVGLVLKFSAKILSFHQKLFNFFNWTDRQADRQIDRQADRQIDRQADRQTGRQTDRQTDRQADRQTGRQADTQMPSWVKFLSVFISFILFCL
jgi:hypothetical protein